MFGSVRLPVCESYVVHHLKGIGLCCAPSTIDHGAQGTPMSVRIRGHPQHFSKALFSGLLTVNILVGWQATQKCSFEYMIKKMDFFFTTLLFSA